MNILEIKNLYKSYDGHSYAVKDLSFAVKPNDFVVLLGLSGSGKSTLLRCVNRLIEPTKGDVLYQGASIVALKGADLRHYRRNIGMVFQQFNLIKNLSVLTNVLSGRLGYHSIGSPFSSHEMDMAYKNLKRVGLQDYGKRMVKQLSGGQQQRVAIARALMQEPRIILADEPVASLDPATADSIMQYLAEINQDGIAVVCSLHFLSLARRYGTKVLALKDGQKAFEGLPSEIDSVKFKAIYGEDATEI